MLAFVIAGMVFAGTLIVCLFMGLAAGMSDAPSQDSPLPLTSTFIIGTVIAALIAASHWLHMSW